MKISLNCSKPALFKGKEISKKDAPAPQPANPQAPKQVPAQKTPVQQPKPQQPNVDTVEISKKPQPKCEGPDCKCEGDACKK